MLAAYTQGLALFRPHSEGYVAGLRRTGSMYVLIAMLLAIAAAYEAPEVIYLGPLLKPH
jgi:hypothetical protein